MLNHKNLIRSAIGLITAGVPAVPAIAAAGSVTPIITSHSVAPDTLNPDTQCEFTLSGSWDEARAKGPSVNVQLWESVDGSSLVGVGGHERIADTGDDSFLRCYREPGTYSYEFRITKGPTHVIGRGTADIVCPPAS